MKNHPLKELLLLPERYSRSEPLQALSFTLAQWTRCFNVLACKSSSKCKIKRLDIPLDCQPICCLQNCCVDALWEEIEDWAMPVSFLSSFIYWERQFQTSVKFYAVAADPYLQDTFGFLWTVPYQNAQRVCGCCILESPSMQKSSMPYAGIWVLNILGESSIHACDPSLAVYQWCTE